MSNGLILWVDDEIDLLHSHILFLQAKGYEVRTVTNGVDAVEECRHKAFDLVLIDEMMPGMSGLKALQLIKDIQPAVPIVMVTKSEEENLMEQAIGSKIADYLIKPVNPNQILLTLKKNIHKKELITEFTQTGYRENFMDISDQTAHCVSWDDWTALYKRLVHWEIELSTADSSMTDTLENQKKEANKGFAKFVKANYLDWVKPYCNKINTMHRGVDRVKTLSMCGTNRPLMSPDLFSKRIFPLLDNGNKVFMVVIDNFRWDQWRVLNEVIGDMFEIEEEACMSILPTATQYARNSIFSGLMPDKIAELFPDLWVGEDEEEGKNLNEEALIRTQMERFKRHETFSYHKINDSSAAEKFMSRYHSLQNIDLNVLVVNFIDMLSHARTESKMVRELANNESAYRSITLSWFRHSVFSELFKCLSQSDFTLVLTTDHGSIRVHKPVKIIGDRNTNTNLRYKTGRNLTCQNKDVFIIKEPHLAQLPAANISTAYVFATADSFFAYPNNYNYYVSYYNDTFQHGGVSMEEMIVPFITMRPRKRVSD